MGFLDRAIRRGVSQAVGNVVANEVQKAVAPKVEQAAANAVNSAANSVNQAAGTPQAPVENEQGVNQASVNQAASTLGGLFGGLQTAATNFANEAAKNMKICHSCGEGASKDQKFCPHCGAELPEMTVAEGAICMSCGKENAIGTKFCAGCGTKLPGAVAEEQAAQAKMDAVMRDWDEKLPGFPLWNGGGKDPCIEVDGDIRWFCVTLQNGYMAKQAVEQYRQLLLKNGFQSAGEYPTQDHLYKMAGSTCCHVDLEHCYESDEDSPTIYFNYEEPSGGFYYVKPEKKSTGSIFDLFK